MLLLVFAPWVLQKMVLISKQENITSIADFTITVLISLIEKPSAGGLKLGGIGVNLAYHPDGTEFPAISLAGLGASVPPVDDALAALAASFAKWYDVWRGQGFEAIREAWLARASGLGTRIRARLATEERSGTFEGIDENGALLLNEGFGRAIALPAADIFFR